MDNDALTALRQAREALYKAVVIPPFILSDALPSSKKPQTTMTAAETGFYVQKCREWHDNGVSAFNAATSATLTPVAEHLPASSIIGTPEFGDPEYGDAWFSRTSMASFSNRCKREEERLKVATGFEGGTVLDHRARRFCLDLRLRSLKFCEWLDSAIVRLETAFLPRLRIGDTIPGGNNRVELHIEIAGHWQPLRPVRSTTEAALVALRDSGEYDFGSTEYIKRFRKDVRELERLLIAKGGCVRALPEAMHGRIE